MECATNRTLVLRGSTASKAALREAVAEVSGATDGAVQVRHGAFVAESGVECPDQIVFRFGSIHDVKPREYIRVGTQSKSDKSYDVGYAKCATRRI